MNDERQKRPRPRAGEENRPAGLARISVVVCTRDRPAELERCLQALESGNSAPHETIVVDNAPAFHDAQSTTERHPCRYVREPKKGLSRARNSGWRCSSGDLVAFIDDDAVPDRDWVRSIADEFAGSRVGVVAGQIRPLEEGGDPGEYMPADRRVLDSTNPDWFEIASFGGIGNGGNMAFRREALVAIGGFDERLGLGASIAGCEEHDAFRRILEAGFAAVSTPAAIVYHGTDDRNVNRRAAAQYAASAAYVLFLLLTSRAHRVSVARYALGSIRGERRVWRCGGARTPVPKLTRVLSLLSASRQAVSALLSSDGASTEPGAR